MKLHFLALFLMCASTLLAQNNLEKHVHTLAADSMQGRGIGTDGHTKAIRYIATEFQKAGLTPFKGSFLQPFSYTDGTYRIKGYNILGVILGKDSVLRDEVIVIGAHYDHMGITVNKEDTVIFNGADDNATGTATVIEMARQLKQREHELKRTIVFAAFDAEESGLKGSEAFINEQMAGMQSNIKWMMSVDMVGMYAANGSLELSGMALLADSEPLVARLAQKHSVVVSKVNRKFVMNTDTQPFLDNKTPAVHAFTGLKSPYHKPEDTAEKLDYEGMQKINGFLTDMTAEIAVADELTADPALYKKPQGESESRLAWGARLNIGASHLKYSDAFFRGNNRFGASAGLYAQVKLTGLLAFQPEVLFDHRASDSEAGNFSMQSLTVPMALLVRTPYYGPYSPRLYVLAGLYYSYHLNGKQGGESLDFEKDYQREEMGFTWGVGIEMDRFQVGLTKRYGSGSLLRGDTNGDVRLGATMFSAGYRF